ncbi:uncharacterized protein LOC143907175 isoform X2 [Temnothorax americanus]|uniref:uncharacterized protein LOC143907175 isoform X2 n=1 Tax=Temnothorax americanus TaxID=1964332 RepID=UPI004068C436
MSSSRVSARVPRETAWQRRREEEEARGGIGRQRGNHERDRVTTTPLLRIVSMSCQPVNEEIPLPRERWSIARSDGRRAAGRGKVGMYLSKRLELRNRGRSGNVRETKRSKLEGRAQCTGARRRRKTKRREGKDGAVACCGGQKTGGGSWLKRQYRRKLIIGLRCTREENKIQASSDCCFQLNPLATPRSLPE